MYHTPSPYDPDGPLDLPPLNFPDFPHFRRVKPLPKRRRTSGGSVDPQLDGLDAPPPLMPPSALSAEELLTQPNPLAALPSYYLPALNGMQDLFKSGFDANALAGLGLGHNEPGDAGNDGTSGAGGTEIGQEGEESDVDYIDQLQQPGNNKKRKVPANAFGIMHAGDVAASLSAEEDEELNGADGVGADGSQPDPGMPLDGRTLAPAKSSSASQRRNRLKAATRAGLQHKELLKTRRRQLASVLKTMEHADPLALEQALSANYPFADLGFEVNNNARRPRVRMSRRPVARIARTAKLIHRALPSPNVSDHVGLPAAEFTFNYLNAASNRLVVTKKQVASLHAYIEKELRRQIAKSSENAKQVAPASTKQSGKKQAERSTQRSRSGNAVGKGARPVAGQLEAPPSSTPGTTPEKKKKKKRSALANASNPHHLRNYVPSRLPQSSQATTGQATVNPQYFLGPPPLRFLSAQLAERDEGTKAAAPVTDPTGEWICPFCEYNLFYGDDAAYRRALRGRKKILRRKRRARERAAAAASGKKTSAPAPADKAAGGASAAEDQEALFEPGYAEQLAAMQQQLREKGGMRTERGAGGDDVDHRTGPG